VICLSTFATALFNQPHILLQLGGTQIYLQLHTIQYIQLLPESDSWWWSYDAIKLGQFQCFGVQVAHPTNWLIQRTGTVQCSYVYSACALSKLRHKSSYEHQNTRHHPHLNASQLHQYGTN
jgi:hypothetical protein